MHVHDVVVGLPDHDTGAIRRFVVDVLLRPAINPVAADRASSDDERQGNETYAAAHHPSLTLPALDTVPVAPSRQKLASSSGVGT